MSSLGFFPAAASPLPSDVAAWWATATSAYGAAKGYQASRTILRIEELDASGAVSSYEQGETRLDWAGPEPRVVVVRAEKDGKDVSAEWRKRYAKQSRPSSAKEGAAGPPAGFDASPFDPKYSSRVARGDERASGGVVAVPYTIATDGGPVEGVARFSSSGAALDASQSWSSPPVFVSYMRSSMRYAYHDGALVVAGMDIEGEASILFIKKRFRMSFEFSEWRAAAGG